MYKLVGLVFRILGCSFLFSLLLTLGLIVVDTVTVQNRVTAVAAQMQDEITRNNCMPTALVKTFNDTLNNIAANSKIVSTSSQDTVDGYNRGSDGIGFKTNLKGLTSINGTSYSSLDPSNAGNYGDVKVLAISYVLHPFANAPDTMYHLNFIYTVPCLRYIK